MRSRLPLVPLLVLLCGGTALLWRPVLAGEEALLLEAPSQPVDVGLGEVRADPTRWRGERVRFTVQFRGFEERWNPGLTRFGPDDWRAFAGWADEDFTWERSVYDYPMKRMFVRRGSPLASLLEEARQFERFEVVAEVREAFFDEPWLEVTSLKPLFELVGEGTILHVGRAYAFAQNRQWDLARQQFERASAAPLPAHARAELERLIGECDRLVDSR